MAISSKIGLALLFGSLLVSRGQPAPPEKPAAPAEAAAGAESQTRRSSDDDEDGLVRLSDRVVIGSNFLLKTNESMRQLVVIGANADIRGHVSDQLVLVGGRAKISGSIGHNLVVVLGSADIVNSARINGEAVLIGGPFEVASGARLARDKVEVGLGDVVPKVEWFKAWIVQCLLWGRLLSYGMAWPWWVAAGFLLIYFTALILFPGSIKEIVESLEIRPVASIFSGFLALMLSAPLTILLVMTVFGIFVIPFIQLALLLAGIFGKCAVICFLGRNVMRSFNGHTENAFFSFLSGALLLTLCYTIPLAGILAFGFGLVFGLGGAIVALGTSFKREEPVQPARVTVPATTLIQRGSAANPPEDSPAPPEPNAVPNFESAAALKPGDTLLLPRAGFWKRVLAAFLDLVLIGVIFIPLTGRWAPLIGIAYFVTMWTWRGTTIGSIVMGLKVVRTDGRRVNFAVALVRSLSSLFSVIVLFLGFIWAAWDHEKQTWHDKIAGTVVVRMPRDFALL